MSDRSGASPRLATLASALTALALILAACAGGATPVAPPTQPPTQSPTPTQPPTQSPTPITQQQAVDLALATDPQLAGIGPLDPDLIGQAAWYEVSPAAVGWRVTVTKGWGDCIAGCISRHVWVFDVDGQGTVTLVEERGDPLESGAGGDPVPPVAVPADGGPWIVGTAVAGPTCPVVQEPPDPGCADRPVGGATVVVRDRAASVVAEVTTGEDGAFIAPVPVGGTYVVEARPVQGLLGTPAHAEVVVPDGSGAWVVVDLGYDTGIR
jgi:hypothetical protein